MPPKIDTEKTIEEQRLIIEAVNYPGVRLLFQKLDELVEIQKVKQLDCDPYTEASAIKRAQEFRYVVKELFPRIMEGLINFDPDAQDKKLPPKKRWSILSWLRGY